MANGYARYSGIGGSGGGGGGGITSVNGATGPAVSIVAGTGINVGTASNTITITNTGSIPTGTANTFAGFDALGALETIPGFFIDTTTGGMSAELDNHPNNVGDGQVINQLLANIEPLQDSPNDTRVNLRLYALGDAGNTGFNSGSIHNLDLSIDQVQTGDGGNLNQIQMYSNIGNATDPITITGLTYASSFGDINDNVTVDGQVQGYLFQPHIHSAAAVTSNYGLTAFADLSDIDIVEGSHSSVSLNPQIAGITNNNNYQGIGINPQITTLTGNAGFFAVSSNPQITTVGATGSISGFSYNPTITTMGSTSNYTGASLSGTIATSHGNIRGIEISPTIDGGDANFYGITINPQGSATTVGDVKGLRIELNNLIDGNDSQGRVGLESDSRIQINSQTTLQPAQGFQIGSRVANLFHIPSGSPVTGTDSLNINIAGDFWAEDNLANGPIGLGYNSVGFIASVAVSPTKTVDSISVFLPVSSLPDPGSPTGGTVTDFTMIHTFAPLSQGGSLTIANLYGLRISDFGAAFHTAAVNAWGVYVEDPLLHNHFAGLVDMGFLQLNGSTSGVLSHRAAAVTTNHTLTWPATQGAASTVLTNNGSGTLSWASPFTNPMTTAGDIIYEDATPVPARLGIGSSGQVLTVSSGLPAWVTPSSSGANTALSNLASTAVNTNILPSSDASRNLGAANLRWSNAYISQAQISDLFVNQAGTGGINRILISPDQPAPSGTNVNIVQAIHQTASPTIAKDSLAVTTENNATNNSTQTGNLSMESGNKTAGTGDSGSITLKSGTSAGGARGQIILSGASINASTQQIHNVVDPTSAQDAATKAYVDANASATNFVIFKEEQTSGTDGGTFTSGAWQTRVLNTTDHTQSWASLSSNQVTLSAGTYLLEGSAPGYSVSIHQSKLRNVTDSTDTMSGSSERAATTAISQTRSVLSGTFTIGGSKAFEIQHQCATTVLTNGFGISAGFGINESYTQIKITKLA